MAASNLLRALEIRLERDKVRRVLEEEARKRRAAEELQRRGQLFTLKGATYTRIQIPGITEAEQFLTPITESKPDLIFDTTTGTYQQGPEGAGVQRVTPKAKDQAQLKAFKLRSDSLTQRRKMLDEMEKETIVPLDLSNIKRMKGEVSGELQQLDRQIKEIGMVEKPKVEGKKQVGQKISIKKQFIDAVIKKGYTQKEAEEMVNERGLE